MLQLSRLQRLRGLRFPPHWTPEVPIRSPMARTRHLTPTHRQGYSTYQLNLIPAPSQALTLYTGLSSRERWLQAAQPLLENYVWPREQRRQKWLAYRDFMASIDFSRPEPPRTASDAEFDQDRNLLELNGRIKLQGLPPDKVHMMRQTRNSCPTVSSHSLLVVMRPWGPDETLMYAKTAIPIPTWRVTVFMNRSKFNLCNAKLRCISRAIKGGVRRTFPGVARTRCDYLIVPQPRVMDIAWETLLTELERIAKLSAKKPASTSGNLQSRRR
ncbi:hypothetical protein IWQ60_003619 [Tieghemiomyces parasiticus]|uniref:Uncharacterized protein n=1 Tax=Tieghemiomyces parasiticus TaxID=78921 RepID=A0A9W8A9V9_9FUNG|nr:hypothetical protein IWQ60_003619 [Tieghemiomyces parasiticus]